MDGRLRTAPGGELPDDVFAELIYLMFQSRIGVRWTVAAIAPPTIYAFATSGSWITNAICAMTWLVCVLRIVVAEAYFRRGSASQPRRVQESWQTAYAVAGILFSVCLGAFTAATIIAHDPWMAGWAISTSVGYAYGIIAYVGLRPRIAYAQTSIPILGAIAALAWRGEPMLAAIAGCLVIGIVSIFGHIRRHYASMIEMLQARRTIERLARTDHLTGLWNRRYLDDYVSALLRDRPGEFAFLAIDLDHFKIVNDTKGHEAGDTVLRTIAERIRMAFNEVLLARVGGDEFVVVMAGGEMEADEAAGRITELASQAIPIPGGFAHIGASVGFAVIKGDDTVDSLSKRADAQMYAVKTSRRMAAE